MTSLSPSKVLWTLLACTALHSVVLPGAQADPAAAVKTTVPGVQIASYPLVRPADIAPVFALPDAQGRLWNSTDLLGQWSMIVVFADDLEVGAPAILKAALEQLPARALELQKQNVTVVVVTATAQFDAALKDARNIVLLREERVGANQPTPNQNATAQTTAQPSLRRMFGTSPT
ncbi:MAG: hypothetical protein JWN98_1036, partial [Abditibacteriota bacterium]|nr:hypothetical protein [Abditibacteriota bacterium]